jgi:hypothetical protein
MSPKGSEAFMWRLFPGIERVCATCGRTLRVKDVGEHRTTYKDGKAVSTVLWCREHRGGRVKEKV